MAVSHPSTQSRLQFPLNALGQNTLGAKKRRVRSARGDGLWTRPPWTGDTKAIWRKALWPRCCEGKRNCWVWAVQNVFAYSALGRFGVCMSFCKNTSLTFMSMWHFGSREPKCLNSDTERISVLQERISLSEVNLQSSSFSPTPPTPSSRQLPLVVDVPSVEDWGV